jgi:hypothetical protein
LSIHVLVDIDCMTLLVGNHFGIDTNSCVSEE